MSLKIGNAVEKIGGDYTFEGIVVAAFKKLSGVERFVVEDDRGVLHVYSEKILRLKHKENESQLALAFEIPHLTYGIGDITLRK